ncbi:hypothetical protein, partial [Actinoplanes sp. NPDC048796]|uniref:hypothetical protein n=1 Tax=Actinoplanes sp. NPDC048796 TaxID=3155640 RepID=UPI0033E8AEE1
PPTLRKEKPAGVLLNWHWLIKHPVEFSKNNRVPVNRPGALAWNYFTRRFPFRQIQRFEETVGTIHHRDPHRRPEGAAKRTPLSS